jgi:hypothetical protein
LVLHFSAFGVLCFLSCCFSRKQKTGTASAIRHST